MVILFIGPSGSGKDTQANLLAEEFKLKTVSTGDLFRDISNGESEIQKHIKTGMNQGWMSDSLTYGLLQIFLKFSDSHDFILNGAVRRDSQIELLDRMLADINKKLDHVFNFVVSKEVLKSRLSDRLYCKVCGATFNKQSNPSKVEGICDRCQNELYTRSDDHAEAIEARLRDFEKFNDKIVEQYRAKNLITDINADRTIAEIHQELKEKFTNLQS